MFGINEVKKIVYDAPVMIKIHESHYADCNNMACSTIITVAAEPRQGAGYPKFSKL